MIFLYFFNSIVPCILHSDDEEDEVVLDVECHFSQAKIDNCTFSIGDCARIQVISLNHLELLFSINIFFWICSSIFLLCFFLTPHFAI